MKKKVFFGVMTVVITVILVCAMIGCDNPSDGGGGDREQPSSVGEYSYLEPAMAPNPSRAVARAGGITQVGIPDYLLSSLSLNMRAAEGVTAEFEVHEDDAGIAEIVSQNGSTCTIRGLQLGSARIIVTVGGQSATMIIAVAPSEALYTLPAAAVRRLGENEFYEAWWANNNPDDLPGDYGNYNADPTYQLAWNWRNKGNYHGASGEDCGIDVLGYFVDPAVPDRRGWVRTTYGFGGWHYDLNGVTDNMTNGVQVEGNVKLELEPEFVYDNGIPYLQITHVLTNTGSTQLNGQKFGASADIMIIGQDDAPLTYLEYGALMTNENTYYGIHYLPTMKLRLVCQNVQGISNVSTMWFGDYGSEREYVYDNNRVSISAEAERDTALNFSYQNISLNAGESKRFVIRFTQVQ